MSKARTAKIDKAIYDDLLEEHLQMIREFHKTFKRAQSQGRSEAIRELDEKYNSLAEKKAAEGFESGIEASAKIAENHKHISICNEDLRDCVFGIAHQIRSQKR